MSNIVNKEQYFETALEVLADVGFKGLNIGLLCKKLGVTSGSFYHHFGSWNGFVVALLEFWENRQVVILRDLAFGTRGPEADVEAMRKLTVGLHHEAEAAIRAWGANDETVRDVQRRVDDVRRKTVYKTVLGVVRVRSTATIVTALGMAMLVGYQQLSADDNHDEFDKLLDEYIRLIYSHSSVEQAV